MAGLIRNILKRSRGEIGRLSPRNPGTFVPSNKQPLHTDVSVKSSALNKRDVVTTTNTEEITRPKPTVLPHSVPQLTVPQPRKIQQEQAPRVETEQSSAPKPENSSKQLPKQFTIPESTQPKTDNVISPRPLQITKQLTDLNSASEIPSLKIEPQRSQVRPEQPAPMVDLDAKLEALIMRVEQAEATAHASGQDPTAVRPAPSIKQETSKSHTVSKVATATIPTKSNHRTPQAAPLPTIPQLKAAPTQPSIEVSIGSIEFVEARAAVPAPTHTRRPKPPSPDLTLSDYLKR